MSNFSYCCFIFSLIITLFFSNSYAEITFDGSLGNAGEVSLLEQNYDIHSHFGKISGNNLFHSFGKFNVNTGEAVTFHAPDHIENIISRITGGEQSFIDGTLVSPTNLYLLNPYGFMLGRNARLNINGSFHLSSADYLRFPDGLRFNTRISVSPLLSVANPEAFGFLGNPPGNITINGSILEVPEGKNLFLIGGNIKLQRDEKLFGGVRFTTPSGTIQIASVASAGELAQSDITNNTVTRLGNVAMTDNGLISVTNNRSEQVGGMIIMLGGQFFMSDFVIENGGNNGSDDIQVFSTKEFRMTNNSSIRIRNKQGQAGNIILRGQQLDISEGSVIFSITDGMKQAGNIIITAEDSITVNGINSLIMNATTGVGEGGNIELRTSNLSIQQGGIMTTESWQAGKAGSIYINADKLSLSSGEISSRSYNTGATGKIVLRVSGNLQIDAGLILSMTFNQGNADNVELKVGNLVLVNGAQINASSSDAGKGGAVMLEVIGTADISGQTIVTDPDTGKLNISPSSIVSSAFGGGNGGTIRISASSLKLDKQGTIQTLTTGDGNAGDIIIDVHDLRITNGADIDASNEGTGSGKGGNIKITATDSVFITAFPSKEESKFIVKEGFLGGIYSIAENTGSGGDVTLSTPELELREGGVISVGSTSAGNAGNLKLFIDNALKMNQAAIITQATQAGGGNIHIDTPTRLHLINSMITTSAQGDKPQDSGGNVTITQAGFVILDKSRIVTTGFRGNGGNIRVAAEQFLKSSDSFLDASSTLGVDGEIMIESPDVDLTGAFLGLPSNFANRLELPPHCASRSVEEMSSFTIHHGKLFPPPDDLKTFPFDNYSN